MDHSRHSKSQIVQYGKSCVRPSGRQVSAVTDGSSARRDVYVPLLCTHQLLAYSGLRCTFEMIEVGQFHSGIHIFVAHLGI